MTTATPSPGKASGLAEPLTTEELVFRVDGLAHCALHMIRNSAGEPFPPNGFTTLMETLAEAAAKLGDRADRGEMRPHPAPGK